MVFRVSSCIPPACRRTQSAAFYGHEVGEWWRSRPSPLLPVNPRKSWGGGPVPGQGGLLACSSARCSPPPSWGLQGEGGRGRVTAIGWRQLLLRDCSGLGRERASHVLRPWNPETGRDKGRAPSLVRDNVPGEGSVGGAAQNCSSSAVLLPPLCAREISIIVW